MKVYENKLKVSSSELLQWAATRYEVELRFASQWTIDERIGADKRPSTFSCIN
jgi:hypothetical protein